MPVRVAAGPLDAAVSARWLVEDPSAYGWERRLPDGQLALLVNLADDRLSWADGPDLDRWHSVSGIAVAATLATPVGLDRTDQRRTIGYVLAPGAARALLGVPADALDQPLVGLDELWGREARILRERLLEPDGEVAMRAHLDAALLRRLRAPIEPGLTSSVSLLSKGNPVASVVAASGLSRSTFVRRFRAEVGLSPKRLHRVARLRRLLTHLGRLDRARERPDWATLAADHGYTEQSHLIAEFRTLTGLTPTRYWSTAAPSPHHLPREARAHTP